MYEISKSDWKKFREKIPDWQERYMECLANEYVSLLNNDSMPASDRFWEHEKRIKKDKKNPGVIIQLKKSDAIWDIATMINLGVITVDDLADFSDDLKAAVALICSRNI